MDALERFRSEFKGWVLALNRAKGLNASVDEVLSRLEDRLQESVLRQIGAAFINGWLENEPEPDRKYFVRETDRQGPRGGQWTVGHAGKGRIDPCWELYIQFADYSRIRSVAERHGLTTRLEDRLMDITVHAGESLLLYVENKVKKSDALKLLEVMRKHGESGFDLNDPDKGNDPLRKAKYLVRDNSHPAYFALSAIEIEQVFRVEYLRNNNRFVLHETDLSLTGPLLDASVSGVPGPRSVVDPLALEIERLAGDQIWVSPGSGATAYNFYSASDTKDAILFGVYEDGRVWTDCATLGTEKSERLAQRLLSIGLTIDTSKQWTFWKREDQLVNMHEEDPLVIANLIVEASSLKSQ